MTMEKVTGSKDTVSANTNRPSVVGIVLAGGNSSRMGSNKALLKLRGQTLLERTFHLLSDPELGLSDVHVSGEFKGYSCIADQVSGLGPLGAVKSCLGVVCDYLLFVPVDLPYLSAAVLLPIVLAAQKEVPGVFYEGSPLPALLKRDANLDGRTSDLLASNENASMYRLHKLLGSESLPVPEENEKKDKSEKNRSLFNLNTPADWTEVIS